MSVFKIFFVRHDIHDSNLWLQVTSATVRNRLRAAGLFGPRLFKKPFISEKNRKTRLEWAKAHALRTKQQWAGILWSDENKYMLMESDGISYVRH